MRAARHCPGVRGRRSAQPFWQRGLFVWVQRGC